MPGMLTNTPPHFPRNGGPFVYKARSDAINYAALQHHATLLDDIPALAAALASIPLPSGPSASQSLEMKGYPDVAER